MNFEDRPTPRTVQRWTTFSVSPNDNGGFVAYGDYLAIAREVTMLEEAAHTAINMDSVHAGTGIAKFLDGVLRKLEESRNAT